jgi:sortase A
MRYRTTCLMLVVVVLLASLTSCAPPVTEAGASAITEARGGIQSVTQMPRPTLMPTFTPTPEATVAPTETPVPTAPPTATPTSTPSATATARPSATPTQPPAPTAAPVPPEPDRIVIPAIKMDAKIIPVGWHEVKGPNGQVGLEWDVAAYAAGWHQNSARPGEMGNMVLSGHHNIDGEVFRYTVNLKNGDQIIVYAGGRKFVYSVVDHFILPELNVSYQQRVDNAKWIGEFPDERLTLVTCWPYTNNTHRAFVVAKPVAQ